MALRFSLNLQNYEKNRIYEKKCCPMCLCGWQRRTSRALPAPGLGSRRGVAVAMAASRFCRQPVPTAIRWRLSSLAGRCERANGLDDGDTNHAPTFGHAYACGRGCSRAALWRCHGCTLPAPWLHPGCTTAALRCSLGAAMVQPWCWHGAAVVLACPPTCGWASAVDSQSLVHTAAHTFPLGEYSRPSNAAHDIPHW